MAEYTLGLSPCPNDTFIFHALLHGLVPYEGPRLQPYFADVEELNTKVEKKALDVSKMSVGAFARVCDTYCLLSSGSALGFGCGPLVVAKKPMDAEACAYATMAIPGIGTTANLLVSLSGKFQGPRRAMLFSDIIPAVARGEVDLGVIIHEGRFTYQEHGLVAVLDLGQWWEDHEHIPLPLGAIAVRRDMPLQDARAIEQGIAASLAYAWAHPDASYSFVRSHAQELSESVLRAHIKTFVTSFSQDLGEQGRAAMTTLVRAGRTLQGLGNSESDLFLSKT